MPNSKQTKVKDQLKHERDQINLIISSMGEGLLVVDRDRKITMINPAAEKLLDISKQDVLSRDWSEIVSTLKDTEKTPTAERSFAKTLATGKVIITHLDDDHYYLTRMGRKFPIVSITAPLKDKRKVIGAVKVFRDATPEKESKRIIEEKVRERTRQLKEEQARLLASINNLPLGFFIIDLNHNVVIINPAMQEILDSERKKWSFEELKKHFKKESIDFKQFCVHCRGGAGLLGIDEVPYGNKILRILSVPITLPGKEKVIGSAVVVEDVTEAKLLMRTKEEFFAVASHELRTPLTAIRGNTSLIQEYYSNKIQDPELKEMLSDIHLSSIRLIKIVNDFLDVSRLEQGKIEFKGESIDLVDVVKESLAELESTASEKGLYLKLKESKAELPKTRGDKDRVKQIIENLTGNGIAFTEEGGVTVDINKDKEFLKVSVTDTGIGISEKNQRLLFKKFQQAGERILARDITRGTGMGLYISKLLTEGMGGEIYLEKSEAGKGSTFVFTLPIAGKSKKG
jgi:PAS domain S-box-containing protein